MKIIYSFNDQQIREVYELYQREWWTKDRSLESTKNGVNGSQINIGIVDDAGSVRAYARVLTDYTFKALVFDIIVSDEHRGNGLGDKLISTIRNHEDLCQVKHFELYCLPEMSSFYEKHGFSTEVGGVKLMRLVNSEK